MKVILIIHNKARQSDECRIERTTRKQKIMTTLGHNILVIILNKI